MRLVNNRLEDFQGARASVPQRIWLKMGVDGEGRILAKEVRILAECGAYQGLAGDVMHVSAMRSDNMHRIENVRSHARLAYTHNPPRGAFRGFGGQQMGFALNSHLDALAAKLGIDPDQRLFGISDNVKRSFTGACKDSGIVDLHFHDLRHVAITRMIQAGMPAVEVMKISGHSQFSTFARYVNVVGDGARRAAQKLDEYLTAIEAERVAAEGVPDGGSDGGGMIH